MKEQLKGFLSYALPIIACFLFVALLNPELFRSYAFYYTLAMFILVINLMVFLVLKIEEGVIKTMPQFFGVMIVVIFAIIGIFAHIYMGFADETNHLLSRDGVQITDAADAFFFSGVTLLSVGYSYISPQGTFRLFAIFEGILGMVVTMTFIALGASSIYQAEMDFIAKRRKGTKKSR